MSSAACASISLFVFDAVVETDAAADAPPSSLVLVLGPDPSVGSGDEPTLLEDDDDDGDGCARAIPLGRASVSRSDDTVSVPAATARVARERSVTAEERRSAHPWGARNQSIQSLE